MRAGRDVVLEVGEAEAFGPFILAVLDDGDRYPGHMRRRHEFRNGGLDLGVLVCGDLVVLSERNAGEPGNENRDSRR